MVSWRMCKQFSLVFLFVFCKVCLVHSTPLMITTQIQSQAQIDAIQHSVDQKQGVPRHLLGALEATESHVVDVENPYLVTDVQSVPLMLLKSIDFDNGTEAWTLKYDTMALDSSVPQQINQYDRVLYFTNGQNVVPSSDANNNCLLPGTDRASCLKHLRENYILLGPANSSLAEQTLEMTVTLTSTLAEFDEAAQQAYTESVAETSEVDVEDVTITSITENDGGGRRLLSTTIDVVTDIKIKSERVDDVLTNKLTLDNLIFKLQAKGRHYSPQFKKPPKKRLPPKLRPPVVVETPAPPPSEVLEVCTTEDRQVSCQDVTQHELRNSCWKCYMENEESRCSECHDITIPDMQDACDRGISSACSDLIIAIQCRDCTKKASTSTPAPPPAETNDENNNPPSVINDPNAKDVEFRLSTDIGSGTLDPPDISALTGEVIHATYPWRQIIPVPYPDLEWHPENFEFYDPDLSPVQAADFTGKVVVYPHGYEVAYSRFAGCGIVVGIYNLQLQGAKAVIVEGKKGYDVPYLDLLKNIGSECPKEKTDENIALWEPIKSAITIPVVQVAYAKPLFDPFFTYLTNNCWRLGQTDLPTCGIDVIDQANMLTSTGGLMRIGHMASQTFRRLLSVPKLTLPYSTYNNQRHLLQTTESSANEIEYVAETHNLDSCPTCAIDAELFVTAGQARQELVLTIPHEVIRRQLGHTVTVSSELYGTTPRLEFGVGMMFLPYVDSNAGFTESPNNVLIFDKFTILENTFKQLAVSKQTSYSIATHIAFWTAAAEVDSSIRVATIEYLLDYGHILQGDDSITASLNQGSLTAGGTMKAISQTDCSIMQQRVDTLESKTCLAKYELCKPFIYTEGSGNTLQTWATIIFPIPDWHIDGTPYQFNTLIRTNLTTANNNQGMAAISTLNFVTNHAPRIACRGTHTQSFDATQHVLAELYRGHDLVFEKIDGLFTIHNTTALSMAESLMTLVLRPDDTTAALDYFTTYDDEKLRLDELYMSHAKLSSTIPSSISNQVHGLPDGRVELVLDSALLQQCPLYDNTLSVGLCTTTKDWDRSGGITRPQGVVYYVHQVNLDDTNTAATSADISWLQNNIFGSSDPDAVIAFRNAVLSKPFLTSDAQTRRAHASVYWIWPVFTWPNTPPIGLVDKTVVSLAWSIAPYA